MNNIFSMYQQFMQNPVQMLNKKFNVPQEMNNPDEIINHLVNSGQVKQEKRKEKHNCGNYKCFYRVEAENKEQKENGNSDCQ